MRDLSLEFLVVEAAGVIDQVELAIRRSNSFKPRTQDRTPILIRRVQEMRAKIEDTVARNAALEQAFQERTRRPIDANELFIDADFRRAAEILLERKKP